MPHRRLFLRGPALAALALTVLLPGCGRPPAEAPDPTGWRPLFDGRSLAGWVPSGFDAEGPVRVEPAFRGGGPAILLGRGTTATGITWTRGPELPRQNYEIELEAMRVEGGDFFCGLTFPVGREACTLVVGGWGGTVVGISRVDRVDAAENETAREMEFADGRWYRIRLQVTPERLRAWIDDAPVVDLALAGKALSLRPGPTHRSLPLGVATYMTTGAIRGLRLRALPATATDLRP